MTDQMACWLEHLITARPSVGSVLQRSAIKPSPAHEAPPIVHEVLRSPGQPLDVETRAFMEPRFGVDFSHVRVHTGVRAAESAQAVNARAYTVGRNVVFGGDQFTPATNAGKQLIAHELVHVVQQNGCHPGPEFGNTDNASAERQATDIAGQVISTSRVGLSQITHTGPGIRLQPDGRGSSTATYEDVWGFRVTRSMCGCMSRIGDDIEWANQARNVYRTCDRPAFSTGAEVEQCFDAMQPGTSAEAATAPGGEITLPPATADPCDRVHRHAVRIHETFHRRQSNRIARGIGPTFWSEWNRLRGTPDRLGRMRAAFPKEVAEFQRRWDSAREWAQGEVESYTWDRRFSSDVLAALGRICP